MVDSKTQLLGWQTPAQGHYRRPDLHAMVRGGTGANATGALPTSCGCSCHAALAVDLALVQAELASLRKQLDDLLA